MNRRVVGSSLLLALVVLWPLLTVAEFKPAAIFDAQNLKTTGNFLAAFLPPERGQEFLGFLARATLETLAIATAGIALAMLLAVPLATLSTRVLSVAEIGPGPGRVRALWLHHGLRALLTVLRGIPELVWALVFVRVFGLGPAAGVLALGLTYGGMLAKVYAEILESGETRPARAILEAGGSRVQALLYGLLPGSAQELTSYTVYRWECAVRASVVMGFVGAGGLGQLMDQAMKMLNGGEASTILLTFLALVLAADAFSGILRRHVANAGTQPRRAGIGPFGIGFTGLLLVAVAASFAFLDLGLAALFSRESAGLVGDFLRAFFPPDLSPAWLARVAYGTLETLAISAVGTLLAVLAGFALALPASGRYGAVAGQVSRFALNALRSVPELVWATLTALSVPHPRAFAAALRSDDVQRAKSTYMQFFRSDPAKAAAVLLADGAAALRQVYGDDVHHRDVDEYVEHFSEPGALEASLNWYAAMDHMDTPEVHLPTTFVWGADDVAIGEVAARGCAQFCTGPYDFRVLEGRGHWLPDQDPDAVVDAILARAG